MIPPARRIGVAKITIEPGLYERARRAAEAAGYSSVEEFVAHCIELELKRRKAEEAEAEDKVAKQLRGLGYIE